MSQSESEIIDLLNLFSQEGSFIYISPLGYYFGEFRVKGEIHPQRIRLDQLLAKYVIAMSYMVAYNYREDKSIPELRYKLGDLGKAFIK